MLTNVKSKSYYTIQIGQRLRDFRKKMKMTGGQLADLLGINRSAISHHETGQSRPGAETIAALLDKTSVNPYWLLCGKGPMVLEGPKPHGEKPTEVKMYREVKELSGETTVLSDQEMKKVHQTIKVLRCDAEGLIEACCVALREMDEACNLHHASLGNIILKDRRTRQTSIDFSDRRREPYIYMEGKT